MRWAWTRSLRTRPNCQVGPPNGPCSGVRREEKCTSLPPHQVAARGHLPVVKSTRCISLGGSIGFDFQVREAFPYADPANALPYYYRSSTMLTQAALPARLRQLAADESAVCNSVPRLSPVFGPRVLLSPTSAGSPLRF